MEAFLAPESRHFRTPLGVVLTRRGLISEWQLQQALRIQRRDGTRLGDILVSEGLIGYYDLYSAVAQCHALRFIDLLKHPPQHDLIDASDADTYLKLRLIPWRREGASITIAVTEVTLEIMVWIRQWFGVDTQLVITSPVDIKRTVEHLFGRSMEIESCRALLKNRPEYSAYTTLTRPQKRCVWGMIAAASAFVALEPMVALLALIALCQLTYIVTMLFKALIFTVGMQQRSVQAGITIDPQALPVYSILIPMYKEASSLPGMLEAMRRMDYPASKLDIKLVLEEDDTETLEAAYALKPRYQFDIIRVPPGYPRTKPKACNYALRFARGEFVTVFDADDRPEPAQLQKAVQGFRSLPDDVVCLQARLNYYNANDNWLTRFFALEYSMLFRVQLPGLERLGVPIPLGGTSNHIALERLKLLGEWDPYNVTEDADLGTRLAARGLRTAMIDSDTMEEAPNSSGAWVKQRSRWIKGYMQTWLVHMRHPATLYETLGWQSFLGFQCFIGLSTFTFLSAPLLWAVAALWLSGLTGLSAAPFPGWLGWLTVFNLGFNIASHWFYTGWCAWRFHPRSIAMAMAAITFPLYLILHSIASYKALWQLIVKPHFWEKTTHGLAKTRKYPLNLSTGQAIDCE